MTRTEPTDEPTGPDPDADSAAEVLVAGLLACGFAERIVLLGRGEPASGLDRAIESRIVARKGSVRRVTLPDEPAAAARTLAALLAEDLPDGLVNRSDHAVAGWDCVRDALTGGSRLVELPGLDDDALRRGLDGLDAGPLRWLAMAIADRIDRGARASVLLGNRAAWTVDLVASRRQGLRAGEHRPPPAMRGTVASLPAAVTVGGPVDGHPSGSTLVVGLHPNARTDAGPLERSRSLGTFTILDADGRPVGDSLHAATLVIDGDAIVRDGVPMPGGPFTPVAGARVRRGRLARGLQTAARLLGPCPYRAFATGNGRAVFAGTLAAQAAWLRGFTGQPVGRLAASGTFRAGGLRRRLEPDDAAVAALGGPRSRLERIGGREDGWLTVPTYARMVVGLAPLKDKGLDAFAEQCHSTKDTLRYIRTKRLGWRTVPADPESIRRFEERYHLPTMVGRHGPEAAIRPPASLLEECGRAEFLEIIHEGRAVGMALFRPEAPRAELLQIGVLDGDEAWLRMRILALCYALPALQCAQRDIAEYDFGRSPPFPWHPVLNFKSKWGAGVDPGPATDRLLVRLPAASPATWNLLTRSGLIAMRRDGRPIAVVAVDAASDLVRLREVAVPGLDEILVVTDGVAIDAVTSALADVRNPRPVRFAARGDLERLASIVG